MLTDDDVERFNREATNLQTTEFRRPRTPAEWQRMATKPHPPDYSRLLAVVEPVLESFATKSTDERAGFASKLGADALGILRTFTRFAPVLAVRWKSSKLITQGLIALTILGDVDDVRDLTFFLATLYFAAGKLGVDAVQYFSDAARLADSVTLQEAMRGFPLRPPGIRELRAFGLRETTTDQGFDFIQDN